MPQLKFLAPRDKGRKENMEKLYINGNRNGYSVEQCGKTLTVGELIEILEAYDEDTPIYLRNDNGYTYGNITQYDIYSESESDEW